MQTKDHKKSDAKGSAHRLAQRIFLTSLANGIAAIAVTIGVAVWMADHANMLARSTNQAQLESALQAKLTTVEVTTQDYAYWDFAHELVTARETDALYDNFGTGAADSETFDFIYVLDGDGTPLYAYQSGLNGSNVNRYDRNMAAPFYDAVVSEPISAYGVTSRFALHDGQLTAVAAARIRPDYPTSQGLLDFPVMIAGKWMTQAQLSTMESQFFVSDLTLDKQANLNVTSQPSLTLSDIMGRDIATLRWTPDRPGQRLLVAALPIILGLSLLTLVSNIVVGRASARQTRALLEQQQLARTDRLTGLINRAGLDELVMSPNLKRAIASGHVAAIYLDLNDFKQLNDSQGHDVGDLALQVFAERVRGTLRADDAMVRLGGDEFVCILIDEKPCQTAETITRRIIAATTPPIRIGDQAHKIAPSIGVAIGAPNVSWQDLQKHADRAMYRAKAAKTAEPVFYAKSSEQAQPQFSTLAS